MSDHNLDALTELFDREKIRDCMARYAQAVDRLDMAMLKAVYWPEAQDNHGPFTGNAYSVFERIFDFLGGQAYRTQHFMGPSLIRFSSGTEALSETYSQNFHSMKGADGAPDYDFIHGARYLDKLEKRGREWRIIDRVITIEWITQGAIPWTPQDGVLGSADIAISCRGRDDILYRFLGNFARDPISTEPVMAD